MKKLLILIFLFLSYSIYPADFRELFWNTDVSSIINEEKKSLDQEKWGKIQGGYIVDKNEFIFIIDDKLYFIFFIL